MLTTIEEHLQSTRDHLKRVLDAYWPATGANEIAEANIVAALGTTLSKAGCNVYVEVPLAGHETRHIDLFAFDEKFAALAEAKRLYSHEKAAEMASDYWRIESGYLAGDPNKSIPVPSIRVACIIATTWKAAMTEWWTSRGEQAMTRARGAGWSDLASALRDADRVGALEIQKDTKWGTQSLLYAVKERSGSPFGTPTRE